MGKCENELGNLSHDLDEMSAEASMSEDKAQRAMVDAARFADELRAEQENAMLLERDRKLLEAQVKDPSSRLDEAEQNALKGGKKAIAKMETRIRELESEVDAESRRNNDAQKNLRKSERRIKELTYHKMRTERTMSACKDLLINFKERSSLTRSRLRKLRRLQLLTSPSLDKPRVTWQTALRDVTSMSRLLPR